MKVCKKCDTEKPLEEFVIDRRNKNGRGGICKVCSNAAKRMRPDREEYLASQREKNKLYYQANKELCSKRNAEWNRNNPEKRRKHRIKSRYGISIEKYDELLEQQNNKCAICGGVNVNGWALSVDHDHTCCSGDKGCGDCVRGLLCHTCNSGLGYFKDKEEILLAAASYVRNFKEK